jgi:hypothetical protein
VDGLEVAVGELVAALRVRRALGVDREVPAAVRGVAVLVDERALLRSGGLVLAPVAAVVEDDPALGNQLPGVVVTGLVQLDSHQTPHG